MKEIVAITLIVSLYLFISYLFSKLSDRTNSLSFIFISLVYIALTNYYFDLVLYIHQNLRSKGIYLEFGHAEIILLGTFGICIVIALINIIVATIKFVKKKRRD